MPRTICCESSILFTAQYRVKYTTQARKRQLLCNPLTLTYGVLTWHLVTVMWYRGCSVVQSEQRGFQSAMQPFTVAIMLQ